MIECGQIWTNDKYNYENVQITYINYRINCVSFILMPSDLIHSINHNMEYVSNLSGFQIRYKYNAKLTNEEIIKNIIE